MAENVPLLMALPQLLGARNAIQYTNYQPNMPMAAMPKAPQMGHAAQMPSMPGISQQRQPAQEQQSPFGGMGGGNPFSNLFGPSSNYGVGNFMPGLFGNAAGYGGLFGAAAPTVGLADIAPNFGSLTIPSLSSFTF